MATFPSLGVSIETSITVEHGIEMAPADSGGSRGEALYGEPQYLVDLIWSPMDTSDRDTLVSFIETNLTAANDIVISGYTYSLRLMPGGGPYIAPVGSGSLWSVRISARGTRAVVA